MKTIYTDSYKKLILQLRQARIERNLTQAEVGRWVGRDRYWVSQIETRAVRLDVVQFVLLCRALRLHSSQVINRLEKEVSPDEGEPLFYLSKDIQFTGHLLATFQPQNALINRVGVF